MQSDCLTLYVGILYGLALAATRKHSPNMPQASQDIDWPLIQTLYTGGMGPKDISAKTGVKPDTIASRASRFRWRELMAKAKQSVQVAIVGEYTQPEEKTRELTQQSQRTRQALGDVIARSAEKLATLPIQSPKAALRVNQDAESMVRNAKTVFGWSDSQSQPSVRISIMDATIVRAQEPDQQPVIECESMPVQLPPPGTV